MRKEVFLLYWKDLQEKFQSERNQWTKQTKETNASSGEDQHKTENQRKGRVCAINHRGTQSYSNFLAFQQFFASWPEKTQLLILEIIFIHPRKVAKLLCRGWLLESERNKQTHYLAALNLNVESLLRNRSRRSRTLIRHPGLLFAPFAANLNIVCPSP